MTLKEFFRIKDFINKRFEETLTGELIPTAKIIKKTGWEAGLINLSAKIVGCDILGRNPKVIRHAENCFVHPKGATQVTGRFTRPNKIEPLL